MVNINDIGKVAHVLEHSHGRCVVGAFEKIVHEVSICTGHGAVLSFLLHKLILLHFVHHGTRFYDKYITSDGRKKYMDDYGSGVLPKKRLESFTMQNIIILIQINIIFLKMTI